MQYENALALRVSLETGLRIGDVLKLRPSDLRGRTITYTASKTRKRGRAVISQDLANRLRTISGAEYIFSKRGGGSGHRSRTTVWKDVKKAAAQLAAAGVFKGENVTAHSARVTFAVEDSEKHGLLHTQKALQHRDKATTKLYALRDKAVFGTNDTKIACILADIDEIKAKIDFLVDMIVKR